MNPLPLSLAMARRHAGISAVFVVLIALAVGIGAAITAQERALRAGGAQAADAFDLIVAAPSSQTDLLLRVVFLQSGSVELITGEPLRALMAEPRAAFVAPIGFGDSLNGDPVVGTIAALVNRLSGGDVAEGRVFAVPTEAIVGWDSPLHIGDNFRAAHGHGAEAELDGTQHGQALTVVGRMRPTGSPWDRAVVVPIEFTWMVHNLGTGHGADWDGTTIGPPFDLLTMPGIPAAVVAPDSLAAAYGLRNAYRTADTMAFFPAEVLVQLYDLLGDVRAMMSVLAIATEVLLIAAVLAGLLILMQLYRQRFAVLRALGASRTYVFAVAWSFGFGLIALGSVLGLAVAAALSGTVSSLLSEASGIALSSSIGWTEVSLALALAAAGALLALLPAALLYRRPVVEALRNT
ncbi:MAG: FtsX-like permease family protein [Bauldia sp.]|nr:FtsX-like permease family protein [Bauldia sp.]